MTDENPAEPREEQVDQEQGDASQAAVNKGGKAVAILILVSLTWYLVADRFTPYTDQARVQGYVIGVAPQVSGTVTEVLAKNNQWVDAGDVLFRIDSSQYEIALQKARSDYENAVRQVDAGSAGVTAARANLRASLANLDKAQRDTDRLQRLRQEDPGTISERRLEISQANLDAARAGVAAAEAAIQQAIEAKGGESGEDNTILKVARTGVEKAELDLQRTEVRADSRGVITDLRTEVGQFAGAGAPVMTLVAFTDVWISAEFTENNLGRMREGTPVDILLDVYPGQVFSGAVSSIGLGVSTTQAPPPGTLPKIDNNRDWLRQSQRFPVIVRFDGELDREFVRQLRIGGQASVVAYNEGSGLVAWLGKIFVRIMSLLAYAY